MMRFVGIDNKRMNMVSVDSKRSKFVKLIFGATFGWLLERGLWQDASSWDDSQTWVD